MGQISMKITLLPGSLLGGNQHLLMRAKGISEDEAYALLRRTAMDQKRKIADIAQALVLASEMLR